MIFRANCLGMPWFGKVLPENRRWGGMKIHIKNMVCDRCKMVVEQILQQMNLPTKHVELGEVDLACDLSDAQRDELKQRLESVGFEWLLDKKARLMEQLQSAIIELVHQHEFIPHIHLQDYLNDKLHYDYTYLNNLFSTSKGLSIKQYLILQKIERAKELIVYDELSFSQIAERLDYSNSAHFSSQFKKLTGLSPREFKTLNHGLPRRPLDNV